MNEKQIVLKLSELEAELDIKNAKMNAHNESYEVNKPVQPIKTIIRKYLYPQLKKAKYDVIVGIIVPIAFFFLMLLFINISWNLLAVCCLLVSTVFGALIGPIKYCDDVKKNYEKQRKSPEYIAKCQEIDRINNDNQNKIDSEYNRACIKYEKELEDYNNNWTAIRDELQNEIDITSNELSSLYDTSKLIPKQYRNANILKEIHEIMDSADYSVKEAIETYDRNRQLQLDAARLQAQNQANIEAAYQNKLIAESNNIAERARRDANIANFVGAVQRHNTNKSLNKINRKL